MLFLGIPTPCLMKFLGCGATDQSCIRPQREVEKASLMDAQRRLKECIKKTQAVGNSWPQGMTKRGCNGIQWTMGWLKQVYSLGQMTIWFILVQAQKVDCKHERCPWWTPSKRWSCQRGSILIHVLFNHVYSFKDYTL